MSEVNAIRQKTWGVFIKPYTIVKEDMYIERKEAYILGASGTQIKAQGGEPYMLYKTTNSFVELRAIVKEVFDKLEQNKNLIKVCEIIPTDYLITPMA